MRRRVKNEDRMPFRRTVGAEKGGSRLAFEGQAIVWCTSTVPGYTVGGRRGRFPDYATKSGVRWLSHKAMHRTRTLVRACVGRRWKFWRSRYDFGWSCGDIARITSRRWRDRGHRGICHGGRNWNLRPYVGFI
jgi:hypothetical protein